MDLSCFTLVAAASACALSTLVCNMAQPIRSLHVFSCYTSSFHAFIPMTNDACTSGRSKSSADARCPINDMELYRHMSGVGVVDRRDISATERRKSGKCGKWGECYWGDYLCDAIAIVICPEKWARVLRIGMASVFHSSL
ncbi:hypothetical protein OH77DRAFT_385326 [Trametes cingulata]|nr:hypothetical protein OH77DRAFT_385326 [Trametes cingulata]